MFCQAGNAVLPTGLPFPNKGLYYFALLLYYYYPRYHIRVYSLLLSSAPINYWIRAGPRRCGWYCSPAPSLWRRCCFSAVHRNKPGVAHTFVMHGNTWTLSPAIISSVVTTEDTGMYFANNCNRRHFNVVRRKECQGKFEARTHTHKTKNQISRDENTRIRTNSCFTGPPLKSN